MDLKELMKEAGIVGAGGAGFPSYAKLAEGADTLVINGAECEPLLYTDYVLLHKEINAVLTGIKEVLEYANIPRALLCVKEHTAKRLRLIDGTKLADKIILKTLPDVYPMGDEISLIYQATGRVVRAGNLPITAGVIVYNVETMYNVAQAVKHGAPLTEKWVTVAGDIPQPIVVKVPIGTPVCELFEKNNITVDEEHTVDGQGNRSRNGGGNENDERAFDITEYLRSGGIEIYRRREVDCPCGNGVLSMHAVYGYVSESAFGLSA